MAGSRKKTHREKYGEAEKRERGAYKALRYAGTGRRVSGEFRSWPQKHYDILGTEHDRAKGKLEKLYAQGHKEALKLNKKYDALVARLQKDAKALEDFEREELKIRYSSGVKRHIGTTVGIISIASFIFASVIGISTTGNIIGSVNEGVSSNFIFLLIGLVFGLAWLVFRR